MQNNLFFWYVLFSTFCPQKSSLCQILQEILSVFSSTRKHYSWEGKRRISEYLMSILKKKRLLGKWTCPYKNNQQELQNQVFHLEIQRCCHQLVKELTKFPVLKCIFLLGKSRCSHTSKIICCRKSDNWNYYFDQFLGQPKYPPLKKKRISPNDSFQH